METVRNVTEPLLTMSEILAELPIGEAQARVYLKSGKLQGRKVRNKWKVTRKALDEFKQKYEF